MDWQIRPHNLFSLYTGPEDDLSILRAYLLLEVSPEDRVEDTMWVSVQGNQLLTAHFKGTDALPEPEYSD
jgi:hypothetical protein